MPTHVVRRLPHELLRRCLPDGGHRDDPADVLVDEGRVGRSAQLLQRVFAEVAQRHREDGHRGELLPVGRRQHRVLVQVLRERETGVMRDRDGGGER